MTCLLKGVGRGGRSPSPRNLKSSIFYMFGSNIKILIIRRFPKFLKFNNLVCSKNQKSKMQTLRNYSKNTTIKSVENSIIKKSKNSKIKTPITIRYTNKKRVHHKFKFCFLKGKISNQLHLTFIFNSSTFQNY